MLESKDHLGENVFRADVTIKRLPNFGSNLESLEQKMRVLLRDQASLNLNLLNRFGNVSYSLQRMTTMSSAAVVESSSSTNVSSSPSRTAVSLSPPPTTVSPSSLLKPTCTLLQRYLSVPGPLQHPYSHLKQSDFLKISGSDEDLEMEDVRDIVMESSIMPLEPEHLVENEDGVSSIPPEVGNQDENEDIPSIPSGSHTALPISTVPYHSTQGIIIERPRHPILFTTTDNISEQIVLELSLLLIEKNNELRLIHTELAKAKIMLEQLRRVHLKPFFFTTNKTGKLYMKRLVAKKITGESREQVRLREVIRRGGMELRSMTIMKKHWSEDRM